MLARIDRQVQGPHGLTVRSKPQMPQRRGAEADKEAEQEERKQEQELLDIL